MTANGRIHISEKSNPEISINTSQFLTKVKADPLYHNEGKNIDLKNNKITNLKDGTENNDAVNFYQLEGKVGLTTFSTLSNDVRWLQDNHVTPQQYQTVLTELGTKVDTTSLNFTTLNSLSTRIEAIEGSINTNVTSLIPIIPVIPIIQTDVKQLQEKQVTPEQYQKLIELSSQSSQTFD